MHSCLLAISMVVRDREWEEVEEVSLIEEEKAMAREGESHGTRAAIYLNTAHAGMVNDHGTKFTPGQPAFARLESVTDVEADNRARMEKLLEWEQGRSRVETDAVALVVARAHEACRMHVPADNFLHALCQRAMPVSLKAAEVIAKLRTPMAKHFKAEMLEPSAHKRKENRLKSIISSKTSLKFIANVSSKVHDKGKEFVRIAVGEGFCMAIDIDHMVFIWGQGASPMMQLLWDGDMDRGSLPDRIKIEYRSRIEKETADLSTHDAALHTRKLEEEKTFYLNDLGAYISKAQGRPSVLQATRHLSTFDIAIGAEHALFLSKDGLVYSVGMGLSGKLGHGGLNDQRVPRLLETLSKRRCIQVSCGKDHSSAVTDNGSLWTWGDNRFGQLGHGNARDCGTPSRVRRLEAIDRILQVACGDHFTAAVLVNGSLYTWGLGWYGQLGHERTSDSRSIPVTKSTAISQGGGASKLARTGSGMNSPGRVKSKPHHDEKGASKLPQEAKACMDQLYYTQAKMSCNMGHSKSEHVDDGRARSSSSPMPVHSLRDCRIAMVACGSQHMLAYESDDNQGVHNVYSWGQGAHGQVRDMSESSPCRSWTYLTT
jgi:alpha-tubulin suppressor-like RCC1 family protein